MKLQMFERLQQKIKCVSLERSNCIVMVHAGEDHDRHVFPREAIQKLNAITVLHFHIEQEKVRLVSFHGGYGLKHIVALGNDLNSGFLGQQETQLFARQGLIGDDGADFWNHHANFTQTAFDLRRPSHTCIDVQKYEMVGHKVLCIRIFSSAARTNSAGVLHESYSNCAATDK